MKQQYENMLCVLSPLMWPNMKPKHLEKGARTGLKGEAYVLWNKDTEIHFLYAGFYKQKGSKKGNHESPVPGLVKSITQHKNFRQLASYSVKCLCKVRRWVVALAVACCCVCM